MKLFGDRRNREDWAFTTNVDGNGTHALRVDWPGGYGSCRTVSNSLGRPFQSPHPARVFFQWKQHMGRTATGGGKGNIGAFSLGASNCSGVARTLWFAQRDANASSGAKRLELEIRRPTAPTVDVHVKTTDLLVPSTPVPFGTQPIAGRDVVHTLYVQ